MANNNSSWENYSITSKNNIELCCNSKGGTKFVMAHAGLTGYQFTIPKGVNIITVAKIGNACPIFKSFESILIEKYLEGETFFKNNDFSYERDSNSLSALIDMVNNVLNRNAKDKIEFNVRNHIGTIGGTTVNDMHLTFKEGCMMNEETIQRELGQLRMLGINPPSFFRDFITGRFCQILCVENRWLQDSAKTDWKKSNHKLSNVFLDIDASKNIELNQFNKKRDYTLYNGKPATIISRSVSKGKTFFVVKTKKMPATSNNKGGFLMIRFYVMAKHLKSKNLKFVNKCILKNKTNNKKIESILLSELINLQGKGTYIVFLCRRFPIGLPKEKEEQLRQASNYVNAQAAAAVANAAANEEAEVKHSTANAATKTRTSSNTRADTGSGSGGGERKIGGRRKTRRKRRKRKTKRRRRRRRKRRKRRTRK